MGIIKYCHTVNILHSNVHKLINNINSSKLWNYHLASFKNTNQIRSISDFLTSSGLHAKLPAIEKYMSARSKIRNSIRSLSSKSRGSSKVITKQWRREQRALNNLFQRSVLLQCPRLNHTRCLHTTSSTGSQSNSSKDDDKKNKKNEQDEQETISSLVAKGLFCLLSAYMLMTFLLIMLPNNSQQEIIRFITWNEFVHDMLAKGEVEEIIVHPDLELITVILYEGAVIGGVKRTDQRMFYINIGDTSSFEDKLRAAELRLGIKPGSGVPVVYKRGSDAIARILAFAILAGVLFASMMRGKNFKSPMSMDSFSQLTRAKFTLINPLIGQGKGVHFADVAGLQEAKQEVMEFVDYLKKPDHYKSLGAKVPKGALLLGPPGCGKTLLAKAVATESNVPFLSMNGSEFIEMIGGLGAARVRDLFKEGRKRVPCIIYIDEIDAIGRKRSSGAGELDSAMGEGEQTLNQLLVEMDGMASIEGIIMLASTNRADVLDKALLRPGRFDRHILIDLPVLAERKEIFEQHLKGIALENAPNAYSKRMAHLTPGFSGADIANVCNEAALHAARHKQSSVTGADLEYAVERVVGGTVKKSHAMSPAEKKVVAYHESGHALVGWLLEYADALLKVTIVPRTNLALGFAQYTPRDQKLYTKEELTDKMCMALGGRAAESLKFNRITTGAQNDLQKVTKMAKAMVREFGMNSEVGLVSFGEDRNSKRPYSKRFAATMEIEEQKLVASAYQRTCDILAANKDKLEALAQALLQKETLNYTDVEKLIGPPPHDNKRFIENIDFDVPSTPSPTTSETAAANGQESQQTSNDQPDGQKN